MEIAEDFIVIAGLYIADSCAYKIGRQIQS